MDLDPSAFADVLECIYGAVPHIDRWPPILERMRAALGAGAVTLQIRGAAAGGARARILTLGSDGLDPALEEAYRASLHRDDPYWPLVVTTQPPALVLAGLQVPADSIRGTPFHARYLEPQGLADPILLVAARRRAGVHAAIAIYRSARRGEWTAAHVDLAGRLLPHAARSLELTLHAREESEGLATVLGALDRLPTGLLLLDRDGRACWSNRVAESILASGEAITRTAAGALRARDPADEAALGRLILDALEHGEGGTLALRRAREAPPILATVAPGQAGRSVFAGASVAVLLSDPARPRRIGPVLSEVFGLTAAEARIAEAMASGHTPKEIALKQRTKVGTVRTHLKAIYAKLHVGRQPDLVRLVSELSTIGGSGKRRA